MEKKEDVCPYCGGTATATGKTSGYGRIISKKALTMLNAQDMFHVICLDCGTVIRSYVEYPKQLI